MQSPEMHLNIIEKNESSVYEAVCYLAQLGHRKIGGIFCTDETEDNFLTARKRKINICCISGTVLEFLVTKKRRMNRSIE